MLRRERSRLSDGVRWTSHRESHSAMVSVNVGAGDLVKSGRNGLVVENGLQEEQIGHAMEVLSNRNIRNIMSREAWSIIVLQSPPNPVKQDEREVNKYQDSINPNNRCGDDDACHLQPAQCCHAPTAKSSNPTKPGSQHRFIIREIANGASRMFLIFSDSSIRVDVRRRGLKCV